MKASYLSQLFVSVAVAACGAHASPPPTAERAAGAEGVIYDPSLRPSDPAITMLVGSNVLSSADSKQILDTVFGTSYLSATVGCSEERADVGGALASGAFVPAVLYRALGSFTSARLQETLYVIGNFECDAGPSAAWGTMTLAIVRDGVVVARVIVNGGTIPARVLDLDRDGRNELLLLSGYARMGVVHEEGEIALLDQTGKVTVRQLGPLWDDDCGEAPGDSPRTRRYSVLFAGGGGSELREERHTQVCDEPASREHVDG